MEAPISLAERARINAENRAKYEANERAAAEAKAARKLANKTALAERRARMLETSCGSVERTSNPRRGCDCDACTRRRKTKTAQQKAARQRSAANVRDQVPED